MNSADWADTESLEATERLLVGNQSPLTITERLVVTFSRTQHSRSSCLPITLKSGGQNTNHGSSNSLSIWNFRIDVISSHRKTIETNGLRQTVENNLFQRAIETPVLYLHFEVGRVSGYYCSVEKRRRREKIWYFRCFLGISWFWEILGIFPCRTPPWGGGVSPDLKYLSKITGFLKYLSPMTGMGVRICRHIRTNFSHLENFSIIKPQKTTYTNVFTYKFSKFSQNNIYERQHIRTPIPVLN